MITVSTFIIDFPTDENGAPSLLVSVVVNEQLIRRLQTYRSDLTVISGAVDLTYLRQKTTNLSGQEKNCNPNY